MTVKTADFEEAFQISEDGSDYDLEQMAEDQDLDQALGDPTFVLDELDLGNMLPGSSIALVELDEDAEEELARESDWEHDGDHAKFMTWLRDQLMNLPQHSGRTTVGCERTIAALDRLNRELSKAIQGDVHGVIDEEEAEKMRDTIYDWKDKLDEAKEKLMSKKKKKKASFRVGKEVVARFNDGQNIQYFISVGSGNDEALLEVKLAEPTDAQVAQFLEGEKLMKEAGAGITLVEDPFLHSIARLLIQAHITHGRDMEVVYANFKDKYDFTPREELSIQELLYQKGFPLIKDLGRVGEGDVRPSEGKGVEYDTEYFA